LKRLYRSSENRVVSGVCGGIAEYLNVDPTLVRIVFVIAVLIGGVSVLFYIVAIFIIPTDRNIKTHNQSNRQTEVFQEDKTDAKKTDTSKQPQVSNISSKTAPYIVGVLFVVVGIAFLTVTMGWIDLGNMWKFFVPTTIILIGVLLLVSNLNG
jgi:phage shock protein C